MAKSKYATEEERKKARCESTARWLAKPGNKEKNRAANKICKQRPHIREAHRLGQLNYAANHREQEKARAAQWRKENPEKDIQMRRAYYFNNRDKVRAASKAYRQENAEAYKEYSRQYKHAKRAGGGRLSRGHVKRMMAEQRGLCRACGCDLKLSGHHIDHIIPIAKGGLHCDANVQLLCPPCNRRKSDKNFEDFLHELKAEAA